jgi:hypothetical protein
MKQKNDLSTLIAGIVSEVVFGVITGVTAARRLYVRNLLLVAFFAVVIALAIVFWDDLLGISVTPTQGESAAPTYINDQRGQLPRKSASPASINNQKPKPPSSNPNDLEELRRLTRPNPM